MDLRQIEYAVAVVDHDGFTRAAAALHVAQPSLSQGIRLLEHELGTPLFHRLGRKVVPTAAGHAFIGPARQLLRDVSTVRAAVTAVAGLDAGQLDVVALATLVVDPVAPLIGAFRTAHPRVAVHLFEPESTADVIALVRSGECEVGATELPAADDLDAIELHSQEILAVCPPGTQLGRHKRLPVARLGDMAIIATPSGTSTRRLVDDALASAAVAPFIAVETAHREAILPLVLAGAGTAFLPAPLAAEAAARGAVTAPLTPAVRRRIGFVHRRSALSPAATAFLELATA